ncbi:EF-hand domain-containing protein [Sphingomonas jinjuensis]|uniref:EF-hand domain-containing protein n=1 Tax=Sphingomonas jinjuensis TaxID=535907 RepID=UPI001C848869
MLALLMSLIPVPQVGDQVLAPFKALPPRGGKTVAVDPEPSPFASPAVQADVRRLVDRDFARFDRDGDGRLDQAEFARWMVALTIGGQGTAQRSWVETAYRQADANMSGGIDRAELTAFIGKTTGWRLESGSTARAGPAG